MKLKTMKIKPKPQEGDIRSVRHFAWWPKQVEDKLIWLEWYKEILVMSTKPRLMWIGKYPITVPWGWDHVGYMLIKKQRSK